MDARLKRLIEAHSTSGDEAEVRAILEEAWNAAGWCVERHGDYAVSARLPEADLARPVLLVCAHMDSPGYAVDRLTGSAIGLTELGSPSFEGGRAPAVLKTRAGRFSGAVREVSAPASEPDFVFEPEDEAAARAAVRQGDRVCFAPICGAEGDRIAAPFLDNRLGCWLLLRLAEEAGAWRSPYRIVLGATGTEEMGGFGARVLAAQVRPDRVVVLDATYDSEEQGVRLGQGPVLTLSDASVLLSPARRDEVLERMARAGVPLQTEAYNFSGTDARAFPHVGLPCAVLPLLVATTGNHSPRETAHLRDLEAWLEAVRVLTEEA